MKLDSHLARLEERTVRTAVTFDKRPTFAKALKPMGRPSDTGAAFDAVKNRLNEILFLMNNGEINPGEMSRLAKIFAGLRQYVRQADRAGMADEFGESRAYTFGKKLDEGDPKREAKRRGSTLGDLGGQSSSRARRLRNKGR